MGWAGAGERRSINFVLESLFYSCSGKEKTLMVYQKGHCAVFENDVKVLMALCHYLTKFHNKHTLGIRMGWVASPAKSSAGYSISDSLFTRFYLSCSCEVFTHVPVLRDLHF